MSDSFKEDLDKLPESADGFIKKWPPLWAIHLDQMKHDLEHLVESLAWWRPCSGCKDGHPGFWKTVVTSPQWVAWEKEVHQRFHKGVESGAERIVGAWDVDESRECNVISPEHFQDFVKWLIQSRPKEK